MIVITLIMAVIGGVIPQQDWQALKDAGVAAIFPPGTVIAESAIELLEKSGQWEGAARMAERLAQAGGDRAIEAKDVATKIRLERFLWDDKP